MNRALPLSLFACGVLLSVSPCAAGPLIVTDGSFELSSNGSGIASTGGDTFYLRLDNWFEELEDGGTGNEAQTESSQNENANANIPLTLHGTFWLNLTPKTNGASAAVYQSLGAWNTGDSTTLTLSAVLGDRSNAAFAPVTFELWRTASSETGADGTGLSTLSGASLMSNQTFTYTENGVSTASTGNFSLGITGVSDGELIWLRMRNTRVVDTNTQSLIDNVSIVPEPSAAGLLGLGLLLVVRRRRRR